MSIVTDLIISNEIPTGDIDGVNKVFTLTKAPNPEKSLELFLNGKLQVIDVDYILYNLTITFETAPWTGSNLKIHYRYVEIAELYLELARITDAGSLAGQDTADFNDDVDGAEKPENNADVTGDHQGDVDGSNINNDENWTDDVAAAAAQATADGKIVTFLQDTEPTADGVGDLWIDTNDTNKLYRWSGANWILVTDTDIAQAIVDAATAQATADSKTDDTAADAAQATADSKIITFYQDAPPTAEATGDFWIDTNDNNKPYRWSGAAWVAIDNPVSDWSLVVDDDGNKPDSNATENVGDLADMDTVGTAEIDDGAILANKFSHKEIITKCTFESLDNWTIVGTVAEDGWPGMKLYVVWGSPDLSRLYARLEYNDEWLKSTKNLLLQTAFRITEIADTKAYVFVGIYISDTSIKGFGFQIIGSVVKGFWGNSAGTTTFTADLNITPTSTCIYRVQYDADAENVKFYVDGIWKATIEKITGVITIVDANIEFRAMTVNIESDFNFKVKHLILSREI